MAQTLDTEVILYIGGDSALLPKTGGAGQQEQQMTDCLGCLGYLENTLRQHVYFPSDDMHNLL